MPRVERTDDAVYRIDTYWLGPDQMTLPWRARYVAYAVWFVTQLVLDLLFIALPGPGIVIAILWANAVAVPLTKLIMLKVSSDAPLSSLLPTMRAELGAWSRAERTQTFRVSLRHVRARSLGLVPLTTPEDS